jgi:hypothetical protein
LLGTNDLASQDKMKLVAAILDSLGRWMYAGSLGHGDWELGSSACVGT